MIALITVAFAVALVAVFALLDAWALTALWGWFLVPLGAPQIGLAHAYGLGVIVALATHQYFSNNDGEKWWKPLAHAVLRPLVAVLCGWIAHKLMVG